MSVKLLERFEREKLIQPPKWLVDNTIYLVYMGSIVYGCNTDMSDVDMYGVCVPPKELVFPETYGGEIFGFGRQIKRFDQYQQHHVIDNSTQSEYDFSIYNIVKYFTLLMENNPNITDSINVRDNHIVHIDNIGKHIRDNRNLFLHKGSMHKFRGYAHSQMAKIRNKRNSSNPKRAKSIEDFGYDVKFGSHVVRLCLEAEQIARECQLDPMKNRETLKAIRRGEWSLERLEKWLENKLVTLETDFSNSLLPDHPDEEKIKQLLIDCLEMKFGNLNIFNKNNPPPPAPPPPPPTTGELVGLVNMQFKPKDLLSDLKKLVLKYDK